MLGRLIGAVVSAPLRVLEVIADKCESVDCLGIADFAGCAADSAKESVEYILDGSNQ